MTRMSRAAFGFLCGATLSIAATPTASARAQSKAPGSVWSSWLASLSRSGYSVGPNGAALLFGNSSCSTLEPVFDSCFGNNPAAPYVVLQPAVEANEYQDPAYANASMQVLGATTSAGTPVNGLYRLSNNEAVVAIITLPPAAAYFGIQSYLFSRDNSFYSGAPPADGVSPDANRRIIFGSIGNSINDVVVKNQSGLALGAGQIAIVSTANSTLEQGLRSAFKAVNGGDDSLLFTEPFGTNLKTGIAEVDDDFVSLIRYALPENSSAGDAWRNSLAANIQVYRISNARLAVARMAQPVLDDKAAASDWSLSSSLQEISQLLQGWKNANAPSGNPAAVISSSFPSSLATLRGQPIGEVGPSCISSGTQCAGDCQDTDTYRGASVGILPAGEFAIVAGVNSAATGNGTYLALAIQDSNLGEGIASVSQTNPAAAGFSAGSLTGSAALVLTDLGLYAQASAQLKADLPSLYVAFVARSCRPQQSFCTEIDPSAIPDSDSVSIIQRVYLKPGSARGANPDFLLSPKLIH